MDTITILLEEYKTLREEVLTSMTSRISILTFGIAAIGVSVGVSAEATTSSNPNGSIVSSLILSLVTPGIVNFVLLTWLGEYERMHRAGKFLANLEHRINQEAQHQQFPLAPILTWESQLREGHDQRTRDRQHNRHMQYPYSATVVILSLISAVAMILGILTLVLPIDHLEPWVVSLLVSLGAVGVAIQVAIYSYVRSQIISLRH